MKAIHVADVGPKQLYFLLESDNRYDGALVEANEPEVYVNFFEYVGNKRSVEPLTNSKFLKFFWTGHHGPLADRWEQNFIDQVIEPSKLLLDGVKILTKFNSTNPPNRAEHLKMRSNRALEYKSLISSGLNEKAFATRGARGLGRSLAQGSRGAATAGIRGFRRGIRFDPNAEDADGDGFVQEGTQHARRVQRVAREVAGTRPGGMRSSTRSFFPRKPDPVSATSAEIEAHDKLEEYFDALVGGTDPEQLLQQFADMEDALAARLGEVRLAMGRGDGSPRPIRTPRDAIDLARAIHPEWKARNPKMEFDLLKLGRDHEYTEYERAVVVAVLDTLSDESWHGHTVEILGNRSNPGPYPRYDSNRPEDPVMNPSTIPARNDTWFPTMDLEAELVEQWQDEGIDPRVIEMRIFGAISPPLPSGIENDQPGLAWSVTKLSDEIQRLSNNPPSEILEKVEKVAVQRRAELTAIDYTGSGVPQAQIDDFIDQGVAAARTAERFRLIGESLLPRMAELIELDEGIRPNGEPKIRQTRVQVAYQGETHPRAMGEITSWPMERFGIPLGARGHTHFIVANAIYASLMRHADKEPAGERRTAARKRAAAIANASIVIHELAGHGQQDVRVLEYALEATGETSLREQQRDVLSAAIDAITTRMIENDHLISGALDMDTIQKLADTKTSLMNIVFGQMGTLLEDVVDSSGRSRLRPAQRGVHGLLRKHRTDSPQRRQLTTWLEQPVHDGNDTPYTATAGLAQYFNGLAGAADAEWGIDLTISEGGQLTLGHVLFGMWPSEEGVPLLSHDKDRTIHGGYVTNRKGRWYGGQGQRPYLDSIRALEFGGSGNLPTGTIVGRDGITRSTGALVANSQSLPGIQIPHVNVIREKGIPALNTTKSGHTVATEPVSGEDAAPLLDAFARATREFHRAEINIRESDDGAFIDEVTKIGFGPPETTQVGALEVPTRSTALDDEIGQTGKTLRELLSGKSKEQQRQLREDIATRVVGEYLSTGGLGAQTQQDSTAAGTSIIEVALSENTAYLRDFVDQAIKTAFHWNGISRTDQETLGNLADVLGAGYWGTYGGTTNSHTPLKAMLNADRYELIAEFVSHMYSGVEFPAYESDGRTRRSLIPSEVSALRRLFAWLHPGREPIIRSAGMQHG